MNQSRPNRILGVFAALLSSALMSSPTALAGIGDVDPAYGLRGVLANRGDFSTLMPMSGGRVVSAGISDGYLNVYMAGANGQPDAGFGPDGRRSIGLPPGSLFDAVVLAAAVAPDGSFYFAFVTTSSKNTQLVHVTSAGALDAGFGVNGVVTFDVPQTSTSGSSAQILSMAPVTDGRVAVLVGYFRSAYDCASDLRIFQLTSGGVIQLEYDHAALQPAVGACSEFGGVTLSPLLNGYVWLQAGDAQTAFDRSGRTVTLHLEQTGTTGHAVTLSADPSGSFVYVAGPAAFSTCSLSRLTPDLLHTGIDGDGDDWQEVDFSSVPNPPGPMRGCKVLAGGVTGFVYLEALFSGADGSTLVAIGRMRMAGIYYPSLDLAFGNRGIAVVGMAASLGLFAEQADGSLLLAKGDYAGGPAQGEGGHAVIKLLGSNLPSPGLVFLEAPPSPVPVTYGTPTTVTVRRTLGSSGAVTASYIVTAQHDGPPVSFSPYANLNFTWGDGEQGARSAEALSATAAVGHYDVDSVSTPAAVFFHDHGSFGVASSPSSSAPPVSSSPNGGGVSNDVSGGGSLDYLALMTLACLLTWQLVGRTGTHSRSRRR